MKKPFLINQINIPEEITDYINNLSSKERIILNERYVKILYTYSMEAFDEIEEYYDIKIINGIYQSIKNFSNNYNDIVGQLQTIVCLNDSFYDGTIVFSNTNIKIKLEKGDAITIPNNAVFSYVVEDVKIGNMNVLKIDHLIEGDIDIKQFALRKKIVY